LGWWDEFFSGLWLEVQTKAGEKRKIRDVDFIEKVLTPSVSSRILDVPCGDGRISLELARRGYKLTGVDYNKALLGIAQQRSREEELGIVWENRDMRDLPWSEEFDIALCWGGSFGYFQDTGNEEFVRAVHRVVKPGGLFFLETHIAETLFPAFLKRDWGRVGDGDILVLEDRTYDHVGGRVDTMWTMTGEGRAEEKRSSIRVYTYRELTTLLERAGFCDLRSYGSRDLDDFRLGSPRLYIVASKSA
jgi:SAM-dependent methyltransferase